MSEDKVNKVVSLVHRRDELIELKNRLTSVQDGLYLRFVQRFNNHDVLVENSDIKKEMLRVGSELLVSNIEEEIQSINKQLHEI